MGLLWDFQKWSVIYSFIYKNRIVHYVFYKNVNPVMTPMFWARVIDSIALMKKVSLPRQSILTKHAIVILYLISSLLKIASLALCKSPLTFSNRILNRYLIATCYFVMSFLWRTFLKNQPCFTNDIAAAIWHVLSWSLAVYYYYASSFIEFITEIIIL